jgi:tetratricopeptide (TPR) repeat protein
MRPSKTRAARTYPLVLAALLASGALPARDAGAQPDGSADTAAIQEAIRLSDLGRLHYEGGDYAEAAEAFRRAFELQPDPVLGYNAARSYENAGELERALDHYRATLALEPDDAALAQRCREAVTRIDRIRARLEEERLQQLATLAVEASPMGAHVELDGAFVGTAPLELSLGAGTYELQLDAPGHLGHRESVTLRSGQSLTLRIALRERTEPETPDRAEGGPSWWAVGVTGGLGIASLLLGAGSALGAHQRYDEAQTPDALRDPQRFDDLVTEGRDLKRGSWFFYGLGVLGLATAVVLYFVTDDRGDATRDGGPTATPGPGELGAGFSWTF